MQFRETQAIYLQIADYVCEKILLREWPAGERVPSVRELAVQLEVFAAPDAVRQAAQYRKELFIEKDLPQVFRSLFLLGMDPEELKPRYEKYRKQYFSPGREGKE